MARALTGLTVIGTASRPVTGARSLGAHHVVNHHDLVPAVREVAPDGVGYVFSPHTGGMIGAFAEVLRPAGEITAIDEPEGLDLLPLKDKSITFHWEFMFTRPLFQTPDMIAQHDALERIAAGATPGPSGPRCPLSYPVQRGHAAPRTPWWKTAHDREGRGVRLLRPALRAPRSGAQVRAPGGGAQVSGVPCRPREAGRPRGVPLPAARCPAA